MRGGRRDWPEEAARLRKRMPGSFFLVSGYGAQGGGAADVIPCFNADGLAALVSSSRRGAVQLGGRRRLRRTREAYVRSVRSSALKEACPQMTY